MRYLIIRCGGLKESMVNLNEKLNLMTSKYCENGNAVKTKIISFFVSNNWFNESPEIINKELYVSDELWENHRDQIEEYCKSSNETSDEKHNKLMKLFERELPETYGYFKRFKRGITLDRTSVFAVIDFLLYFLPGELAFSDEKEVGYLVSYATEHLKRCDAEVLVMFINWLSASRDITTGFSSLYQVNNYKKQENNDAYSKDFYLKLLYHLLNEDYISENHMYQKSAESKAYVDAWLFMSLHFICALRITDLKQFPHPHLPCPPEDVLQKVKEGTFTNEEAKKTQASICYILDATMPVPNKTKAYSGVPSIHFHIPSSLEVHFGTLFAVAEAHFQLSGTDPDTPLIREIREYRDIKKAMGDKIGELFLTSNFHCRQMNKSFLQMIENLTSDVIASNGDFNVKGYELASRARSHKGSYMTFAKTTRKYLRDQKMTGYSPEFVVHELLERGVLSNVATMLLRMLYGEQFTNLEIENQTKVIQELEMSPLEIENSIGVMQSATEQAKQTAVEICNSVNKEEILMILHRIGNGEALSKTNGSHCMMLAMKKQCPFSQKGTCIGCPYEVSTKTTIFHLAAMSKELLRQYKEAPSLVEKDRLKTIVTEVIAPKLQEVLICVKENYGEEEFKIMNDIVKEVVKNG